MTDGIRMIDGRRMRCEDLPDTAVLDAVADVTRVEPWATTAVVLARLETELGPVPWNLFLAKVRKLVKAGKLNGCACGCRGEFTIPAA